MEILAPNSEGCGEAQHLVGVQWDELGWLPSRTEPRISLQAMSSSRTRRSWSGR